MTGSLLRGGNDRGLWYESPEPPAETRRAEIELSDSRPRTITLTEIVECWGGHEGAAPDDGCVPLKRTTGYGYFDNG